MNSRILSIALFATILSACHQRHNSGAEHESNGYETAVVPTREHPEEEIKFQYTAYSNDFELFAEADAFVAGESANVLSHFSVLPGFRALESGAITLVLIVNGKETRQKLEKPARKGIYSFDVKPETPGTGSLKFEITTEKGNFEVNIPEIVVFASHKDAHEAGEAVGIAKTNTTVFTKEQSWKVDFSTGLPTVGPFGEVIKTTALVQPSQGNERVVSSRTEGIVRITVDNLLEGIEVSTGQTLLTISGSQMSDNNITVRFAEARNNYEKSKADYERALELAKDKIVSDKDLMAAKNQVENSKAVYDNLKQNFSADGQTVVSPMSGFIKQVFVKNGSYVGVGQPLVAVSQNRTLTLTADLPMKYAAVLGAIYSANIRTPYDNKTYTLEELNGRVLAFGKSSGSGNYLVPVSLQINNTGGFIPGSFVEVYLKTVTSGEALTVPVTAVLEEQGNYFVWVQVNPELFEKREVSAGKTDGVQMQILEGLHPDERIVTRGAMLIKLAQATGTLDAHSGHVH